ncbi:hypothetical protein BCE02nite_55540 [Brevibacillus centrosporus]|nr:hypothetical protein BCE02nite_55540 [Brevibacillus centrosporus]
MARSVGETSLIIVFDEGSWLYKRDWKKSPVLAIMVFRITIGSSTRVSSHVFPFSVEQEVEFCVKPIVSL